MSAEGSRECLRHVSRLKLATQNDVSVTGRPARQFGDSVEAKLLIKAGRLETVGQCPN